VAACTDRNLQSMSFVVTVVKRELSGKVDTNVLITLCIGLADRRGQNRLEDCLFLK